MMKSVIIHFRPDRPCVLRRLWEEIGAVVVVTLCPDYFVPHIGNIIQAECGLNRDVLCVDLAQG